MREPAPQCSLKRNRTWDRTGQPERAVGERQALQQGGEPGKGGKSVTLSWLEAFQPVISQQAHRRVEHLKSLYQQMIRVIAQHRVADRPDRFEPRMTKRRPKNYNRLTRPRKEINYQMLKDLCKI
jgi:hypothetical protein